MKTFLIIALSALLASCSTASSIKRASESKSSFNDAAFTGNNEVIDSSILDEDAYRIFHQAATGFVSIQSIRESAEKRAIKFCGRKNKVMQTLSEHTSSPPHIFGNFPRIEIVFSCEKSVYRKSGNKYDQIKKLKVLLDDGALTSEEYQNEKNKVLSN
jgi:hypothetical protein